jgi:hypothetical protein
MARRTRSLVNLGSWPRRFMNLNDILGFRKRPADRTVVLAPMRRNHLIAAAGICLALIIYATLARLAGPCGGLLGRRHRALQRLRPVGFLLSFLLPGRLKRACAFVVAVAVGLEVLQAVTPDRDPRLIDMLQKAAGGTIGVLLAQTILAFLPRPPS